MFKFYFLALLVFWFMAIHAIHMHFGMSKEASLVYAAIACVAGIGLLIEHLITWRRRRQAYKDFNAYSNKTGD